MNPDIKAIVNSCNDLKLKVNAGGRHRIMKNGMSGSLWLEVQQETYRLKLTGEVKSALRHYVLSKVGDITHEDQGDPVWHLPFNGSMEAIVSDLDKI